MTAINFSGLASGLDTSSIVTQLVNAEKALADPLTSQQSDLTSQKSIVGSMSSALSSFATAVAAMNLDSEVKPLTATVSDSKVSVAVASGAAAGVHSFFVEQLATSQVSSSATFTSSGAGAAGAGGLDITKGGVTQHVTWDATNTLDDIASKINGSGSGLSASVLYDGAKYRLMVSSTSTGTANAATYTDVGGGALGMTEKAAAKDAIVDIDGVPVTRSNNIIADALTGTTITLNAAHAATDQPSKATVALDTTSLTNKVKAVVDAYNTVNAALHVQLDYNGTTKGSNTLFGDSTLRNLQGSLASIMSSAYGTGSLADIGLSRDKTGTLTLDTSKLTTAVANDPDAVSKLFVAGGFAKSVADMATTYTATGTGLFDVKTDALTSRYTALQTEIDRINTNADALQTRLEAQFNALEQAMSSLKNQSSQLTAMLGSSS